MSWFYRHLLRPALFTQDAELAHQRALRWLSWAGEREPICDALDSFFRAPTLPVEVFGLRFPNPVGLAAGMDKHAEALPAWPALGFGFTELGAATWHPQPGNPAPRLFRAIADEAIVNRMGFNNPGAEVIARNLARWRALGRWPNHPVGMNLGKSKTTSLDRAPEDYARSFRVLLPHLDFFVVNVSSPNTPNLRQLQNKAALDEILAALGEVQNRGIAAAEVSHHEPRSPHRLKSALESRDVPTRPLAPALSPSEGERERPSRSLDHSSEAGFTDQPTAVPPLPFGRGEGRGEGSAGDLRSRGQTAATPKPILVKVAPDLSFEALDQILELVAPRRIAGIVATNTTITRPQTIDRLLQRVYAEPGGLSGRPLRARSTEIIRHLYRQTRGTLPLIGVGGIFTAADAWEKITAGASLVQLYTGLVYEGPSVVKDIVAGLLQRLEQAGMRSLKEAIGTAVGS
jgi:dihydroorotate dehydrogenase